jgi:cytochrome c-type biogenesis protein CcmH
MTLWIILTLMIAGAVAGLTIPLVRRVEAGTGRGTTLAVLKDQLRDLDAQNLPEAEADGLRNEIKRRILAEGREDAAPARPLSERHLLRLALGLAAVVALAATGLYAAMGRPDLATKDAAATSADHPTGDVAGMIGQLEARLAEEPGNAEAWRMLGWSYHQTGRFGEAAAAYGRAAALDPGNAEYLSAQGESLVQAADGVVTPAALGVFNAALAADPADPRARYFIAVARDQGGDHKGAMEDWIALLADAPPGAPWAAEVRAFVERIAPERGEDVSARLPPLAASPGPTPEQMAAAGQMPQADQQAMIRGMVDGLDARLKAEPRDADGWVRLMRARMVLGETAKASAAYRSARQAFADDPARQATLRDAARSLGVPGA